MLDVNFLLWTFERSEISCKDDPNTAWGPRWFVHDELGFGSSFHLKKHSERETIKSLAKQNVVEGHTQETIKFQKGLVFIVWDMLCLWTNEILQGTVFLNLIRIYWCKNSIYQSVLVIILIKSIDRFMSIRSITYRMEFLCFCHDLWEKGNNPF
jgi:hypothetical protein